MSLAPHKLSRLSTLLDEALALTEDEREAWLASLRGEDAELGPTLRDLLARRDSPETLLIPGAAAIDSVRDSALASVAPSNIVGPYRILRVIGQGGMGEVWLAERADGTLKRKVALKLPYLGWAPGLGERFAREREILEALDHPLIARLYDGGFDAHGRPYMALEYVEGVPITAYCNERALAVRERIGLVLQVADAIAFAHSRLVLHRDLKPANILVTTNGEVRLLDFGIAKLMERGRAEETALTQASGRALTLDYASPEQIRGEPIGTASDVYSLGVVAYEILAGARPYRLKHGTAAELEQAIANEDTPPASSMAATDAARASLRGDLDAILNKALKKSSEERYATVDAFAQDLRNYLAGSRVLARPDTLAYRVSRLARRYRTPLAIGAVTVAAFVLAVGFGATAVVVFALLVGIAATAWQAARANREARATRVEARRAEAVKRFLLDIFETNSHRQSDHQKAQHTTARELLDLGVQRIDESLRDEPEAKVEMLATLVDLYFQIGLRTEAARLAKDAVATARQAFGPRDRRFARAAIDCARALEETPDRDEAPKLLMEADAALMAAGEGDSETRGVLLRNLAAYHQYESLPDFVRTAEQSAAILLRCATGIEVANACRIAGRSRIVAGDVERAEGHFRTAIESPRVATVEEGYTIFAHAELAESLSLLVRLAPAEDHIRTAAETSVRIHGPAHRWTLVARMRLFVFLSRIGKRDEARRIRETVTSVLAEPRAEFDDQFRADITAYDVAPFIAQGRPDLAEAPSRLDLDDLGRHFAHSHAYADRLAATAAIVLTYGHCDQAESWLREGTDVWQRYAKDLAHTARSTRFTQVEIELALARGDVARAVSCAQAAQVPSTAASGRFTPASIECAAAIAHARLAGGDAAGAHAMADDTSVALRKLCGAYELPDEEARLLVARGRAACVLARPEAAQADLRRAVALRRANDDPASLRLAEALLALAECAPSDEARALVAEVRAIHAQHPRLGRHITDGVQRTDGLIGG
jgi:serine/threonine-protein kinase